MKRSESVTWPVAAANAANCALLTSVSAIQKPSTATRRLGPSPSASNVDGDRLRLSWPMTNSPPGTQISRAVADGAVVSAVVAAVVAVVVVVVVAGAAPSRLSVLPPQPQPPASSDEASAASDAESAHCCASVSAAARRSAATRALPAHLTPEVCCRCGT